MDIFYYEERKECINYIAEVHVGFKYMEIEQGVIFNVENKQQKHIFFFLEGSAKVCYNEFPYKEFGAGEMIFLPKSADCKGEALTKCRVIVLIYDNPAKLCDKVWLNTIIQYAKNVKYEFKSLLINYMASQYLNLLRQYLQDGVSCLHLHELKQKELFLLMRAYYREEDLTQFFFPMIGKSMDFRSKVMAHFMSVRTVKELACICSYSPSRFAYLFLGEFGEPPYQWMQKQKSKHVIGRLSQTDVSIKEIVAEFNFTCPSHFGKYCMKQFGGTPTHIREELLSGNQVFSVENEKQIKCTKE